MADFYADFSGVPGWASPGQYKLHTVVTQASQNILGNFSTDAWAMYIEKQHGTGYFSGASGGSGGISGDLSGSAAAIAPYDFRDYVQKLIGSGSGNVAHNPDGTKTASGSFSASDSADPTIGSASGSWALGQTPIPRGAMERHDGSGWKSQLLHARDSDFDLQQLERYTGSVWARQR